MADFGRMIRKNSIVRPQRISNKLEMYIDFQSELDSLNKEAIELLHRQEAIRTEIAAHLNPGVHRILVGNKLAVVTTKSHYGNVVDVGIDLVDIDYIYAESDREDHV